MAILRTEAGRNPYDRSLSDLVGELSMLSEDFRIRWATHNVRFHRTGVKDIRHPVVGDLHLMFEAMDLAADPGLSIVVYTAEPNSPTQDGLNLLASWTLTADQLSVSAEHVEARTSSKLFTRLWFKVRYRSANTLATGSGSRAARCLRGPIDLYESAAGKVCRPRKGVKL